MSCVGASLDDLVVAHDSSSSFYCSGALFAFELVLEAFLRILRAVALDPHMVDVLNRALDRQRFGFRPAGARRP